MFGVGTAIKTGFKALLGGSESGSKILDATISGIDSVVYTEQEKAEDKKTAVTNFIEYMKVVANQSTPTAISRRIVAWGVISLVWYLVVVSTVLIMLGKKDMVEDITAIGEVYRIGWAFGSIIIFYFGPHLINAWNQSRKV